MYRTVLCFRYVMSRFLTLVATLAVLLGVGTLIVVMAVMGGFVKEVRQACRGGLSDVIIMSDITGFPYYDEFIAEIKTHPNVDEATPVVWLYGLARIKPRGYAGTVTKPCMIYGVRPDAISAVSKFREYLRRQKASERPTFELPEKDAERLRTLGVKTYPGCIPGDELVSYYQRAAPGQTDSSGGEEDDGTPKAGPVALTLPGDKLVLTVLPISARGTFGTGGFGSTVSPTMRPYTVVDYYKSRLYELDSKSIFIPFEEAQILGELGDPTGGNPEDPPRALEIRVLLKDYAEAHATLAELETMWNEFRRGRLPLLGKQMSFMTWEEQKATLLGVVNMERALMIILLGLILIVAGFLIGAVLTMIVKEKTRDIGIMKSLGASNFGVAQIFLYYGALVSGVGALLGLVAGKVFIHYIDGIEAFASSRLGFKVFPREAYYFDKIPRYEDPMLMALVVVGAVAWAVLCSTVAAYRALRLQPVEALRYE